MPILMYEAETWTQGQGRQISSTLVEPQEKYVTHTSWVPILYLKYGRFPFQHHNRQWQKF